MFRLLVNYLGDRYASIILEKPIEEYRLLVERIKSAIPCFNELQDDEIRIAYEDVHSGCFINISGNVDEQFHLTDTFSNIVTVGAYDRIMLKVCKSDSPLLIRKKSLIREDLNEPTFSLNVNDDQDARPAIDAFMEYDCHDATSASTSAVPKQLNFAADVSVVQGWKENKIEQINNKLQLLEDKKIALETHLRELEIEVPMPMNAGTYRTICSNCHIRGHRADGNRNNNPCYAPTCTSYFSCGQLKRHPEHLDEVKGIKKQLKDLIKEIDKVKSEKRNMAAFHSKSISAFATAMTTRLTRAFPDKYSLKTASGKLDLQRDLAKLRMACDNKVPANIGEDRSLFQSLLEKETKTISEVKNSCNSASTSNVMCNTISVAVSPVSCKTRKPAAVKRRRDSTDSSTDDIDSDSSFSSVDTKANKKNKKSSRKASRIVHEKRHRKRKKYFHEKYGNKTRRHRRISRSNSSSESESVRSDEDEFCYGKKYPRYQAVSVKAMSKGNGNDEAHGQGNSDANHKLQTQNMEQCSLQELATIAVAINDAKQ